MKYIELDKLSDKFKQLCSTKSQKVGVYETAEEFLSCNNTVTNKAIVQRISEKVEEYKDLPEGLEKEEITNAINGMYVGMDNDPAKRTPENYYKNIAITELYNEEREKQQTLLNEATPIEDKNFYALVGHDYDRYEGGDFAVGLFSNMEALKDVVTSTTSHYNEVGGSLASNLRCIDSTENEVSLDVNEPDGM